MLPDLSLGSHIIRSRPKKSSLLRPHSPSRRSMFSIRLCLFYLKSVCIYGALLGPKERFFIMQNIKFWSHKLFKNHPKAIMSYRDIARLYGISTQSARNYIRRDLKLGLIFKDPSPPQKNCYYLTPTGYSYLHQDLMTPPAAQ